MAYPIVCALWFGMYQAYRADMPSDIDDICTIFDERRDWYAAAKQSEDRWDTPVHIQMAILHQESSFRFNARPPRRQLLGFIPWFRPSNAYGFAQALDDTWQRYQASTGRHYADRDDFHDAIDFVGWYTNLSHQSAGVSKWDPYNQYLAYHEGQAGFERGSHEDKAWLTRVATRVDRRARNWWVQLQGCEASLRRRWWQLSG